MHGGFILDSRTNQKLLPAALVVAAVATAAVPAVSNATDHCDPGRAGAACQVAAPDPQHIEERADREQVPREQRAQASGDVTVALTGQSMAISQGSVSPEQTGSA